MRTILILLVIHMTCCGQSSVRQVGGGCEACNEMLEGMPANLSRESTIAVPKEPGERLVLRGTIFKKDGKTPASNVILYIYHTDNKGLYSLAPGQTQAKRHGHLRGWIKTGEDGRYQFNTIRPAGYPNNKAPQHIHPLIKEPDTSMSIYWIDEFLFDDDPRLTSEEKNRQEKHGGNGVIHLTKNSKGEWIGQRDIILGLNIPNY